MTNSKESIESSLPPYLTLPYREQVDILSNKLAFEFAEAVRAELGVTIDDLDLFFEQSFQPHDIFTEAVLLDMQVKQEIAVVAERYAEAAKILDTNAVFESLIRFTQICSEAYDSMQVLLQIGSENKDELIEIAQYVCASSVQFHASEFTASVTENTVVTDPDLPQTFPYILHFSCLFNPWWLTLKAK